MLQIRVPQHPSRLLNTYQHTQEAILTPNISSTSLMGSISLKALFAKVLLCVPVVYRQGYHCSLIYYTQLERESTVEWAVWQKIARVTVLILSLISYVADHFTSLVLSFLFTIIKVIWIIR